MTSPRVIFYWRPGCGFCARLERGLTGAGISLDKHNIWGDETAAAAVRVAANGNETVPTVVVGDTALVNPTVSQVQGLLASQQE